LTATLAKNNLKNMIVKTIKKFIWSFTRKRKINKVTKDSMIKNEKILEHLGDEADYDGMGDWGRFPPIKKK
tara:strand:- start:25 stop:237 length:213 start_codon:yes stop_codon:yes gene_type:complete